MTHKLLDVNLLNKQIMLQNTPKIKIKPSQKLIRPNSNLVLNPNAGITGLRHISLNK